MLDWRALLNDERGSTAPEYGLIVAAIALVLTGFWSAIGTGLADIFGEVSGALGPSP